MNRIIQSFLDIHKTEYSIENWENEVAFEHFINKCIVNKYSNERFDPSDIMTDPGEKGLDGVAICINGRIVNSIDEMEAIFQGSTSVEARFVFIQTKTSEKFDGSEIGNFLYGVRAFFSEPSIRPVTNEKMENLIKIKDAIYTHSIDMEHSPILDVYYVCCGKWDEGNGLSNRIQLDLKPLEDSQDFLSVNFYPYDAEKIITTYKELKKKVTRIFPMEKKVTFPVIQGVKQAFLGLVKCKDFVSILSDSDDNMLTNIFEDNVRDFQGYNIVNSEIQSTIENCEDQARFGLLNNGITIVAKRISPVGDSIEIYDYQIVNGCQTSYVLFDNRKKLSDDSFVMVKLIEIIDEEVSDRVIYTTNRQTEVKSEAFIATKHFHKRLQDYYNALPNPYRLYYERRSKQYDLDDTVSKNRVITLTQQIQAYLAMFLNEPHSTHRYYGELLRAYENKLFLDTDDYDPYFCAAYFLYYVDSQIRAGQLDRKYKKFKFHIICAMRSLIAGSAVVFGKARQQQKICEKLWTVIKADDKMKRTLDTAISCIENACDSCSDVPKSEQHRSKEITTSMISYTEAQTKAQKNVSYLKKGDIVHCTVTAIKPYSIDVSIRTEDARNYGSIYISRIAKKYIEDIRDEVTMGQIFQAKIINDDFYEKPWGWELSKIF